MNFSSDFPSFISALSLIGLMSSSANDLTCNLFIPSVKCSPGRRELFGSDTNRTLIVSTFFTFFFLDELCPSPDSRHGCHSITEQAVLLILCGGGGRRAGVGGNIESFSVSFKKKNY